MSKNEIKPALCVPDPSIRVRELVKQYEQEMQCNCDLDNWQPERISGHSWVCRIHKRAIREVRP